MAHAYPSNAQDFGWSLSAINGQNAIKNLMRDQVLILSQEYDIRINGTTTLIGFVAQGIQTYNVHVIVAHGAQYYETTELLAKNFPATKFVQVEGYDDQRSTPPPNMNVVSIRQYKGSYLGGYIAGMVSRTNSACYVTVGDSNGPSVQGYQGANAWAEGFKRTNPNGRVHVINILHANSFELSVYAADRMFNETCCDVIISETDGIGPLRAARNRDLWGVGSHSDQFSIVDVLTSRVWMWAPMFQFYANSILNNQWENSSVRFWPTSNDTVDMTSLWFGISKATKDIFDLEKARIITNEEDDIFCGPKYGKANGVCLTDTEKFAMRSFTSDISYLGLAVIPCPSDCNNHGNCTVEGTCECSEGYYGPSCVPPEQDSNDKDLVIAITIPLLLVFILTLAILIYKYISNRIYQRDLVRWRVLISDIDFNIPGKEKKSRGSSMFSTGSMSSFHSDYSEGEKAMTSFQNLDDVIQNADSWRTHTHITVAMFRGESVAVKLIDDGLDETKMKQYTKEIIAVMNMSSPNLVPVLGCTYPDSVYIISKYMARGSLEDVIHDDSVPLTTYIKLSLAEGIASGMKYLHHNDIYHESFRPSNILVDDKFRCAVSDYGMSSFRERRENDMPVTLNHLLYEAPEFIAPKKKPMKDIERLKKGNVYSFAMIQLELMVRNFVYAEFRMIYDIEKIITGIRDKQWRPRVPKHLHEDSKMFKVYYKLIVDCWNANPLERYDFSFIEKVIVKTNKGQVDILQAMMAEMYMKNMRLEQDLQKEMSHLQEELKEHTQEKLHQMPTEIVAQGSGHQAAEFKECCVLTISVSGFNWKKIKDYTNPTVAVEILDACQVFFQKVVDEVSKEGIVFAVEESLKRFCYASTSLYESEMPLRAICNVATTILARFSQEMDSTDKVKKLGIKMGIASGPAYGGVIGRDNNFVLYGDCLDISEQICNLANADEILLEEKIQARLDAAKGGSDQGITSFNFTVGISGLNPKPGYKHSILPPSKVNLIFKDSTKTIEVEDKIVKLKGLN
eukprot:Nk52_evm32s2192 gene=Nk52_evmTU32s2192